MSNNKFQNKTNYSQSLQKRKSKKIRNKVIVLVTAAISIGIIAAAFKVTYNLLSKNHTSSNNASVSSTKKTTPADPNLTSGLDSLNSKDYVQAFSYFNKVDSSSSSYNDAQIQIKQLVEEYKKSIIASSDELVARKHYTEAINALSSYNKDILKDDDGKQIDDKIASIKMFKEEYTGYDEYDSDPIMQPITPDNVNKLSIESNTKYFLYTNLEEQNTYVYEGSSNNWKLVKNFQASSGARGQETPKGTFSITGRGDWFFAQASQEGAKYYIQFMGDYLYHSLPFDESKTNVVDATIGKPASHGCIRSNVEDAKWLYDNIPDHTKVIIN